MSYTIIYDEEVVKFISKLEVRVRKRILDRILKAKQNPHHFLQRLSGRSDYKLRVGEYRLIADVDDNKKRIAFTHIEHRRVIYKKI